MKKVIVLLSVLLLLNGCGEHKKEKENKDTVPVITVDPEVAQAIDLSDISKNTSFIRLETNSNCLVGDVVSRVEIINDKIFVFCSGVSGDLYCFDLNGKFLFRVGSIGHGPGEYISLMDFAIDKENECLWLGDMRNKILKYDFDGNFIESFTTEFAVNNLTMIDEKEGIMAIRLGFYRDKKFSFIIYSINDSKILSYKESKNINLLSSIAGHSLNTSKESVIYTESYNDTIFTVSKKGIVPYYVIDFGRRKLPKDLLDNNPTIRVIYSEFRNPDNRYAGMVMNANEDSKYLFYDYTFSGKGQTAIYSFESNKVINVNEIAFMGKQLENTNIKRFFHIKQDNKFISFLPAHLLTEKTVKEKQGQYGSYSNITDLLPDLSEDDNPVMVIGEYNFDGLF